MKRPRHFPCGITAIKWKHMVNSKKYIFVEPLDKFQPNLARSIPEWREYKRSRPFNIWQFSDGSVSYKWGTNLSRHTGDSFPWGDNSKIVKIHWRQLDTFFSIATEPISSKHDTKHPLKKGMSPEPVVERRPSTTGPIFTIFYVAFVGERDR